MWMDGMDGMDADDDSDSRNDDGGGGDDDDDVANVGDVDVEKMIFVL
jgi:hypothetical protein